jgi:hypothetical protein
MNEMELDPLLELIVCAIKNSELDCCLWEDGVQRELAVDIAERLEARFNITFKDEQ